MNDVPVITRDDVFFYDFGPFPDIPSTIVCSDG